MFPEMKLLRVLLILCFRSLKQNREYCFQSLAGMQREHLKQKSLVTIWLTGFCSLGRTSPYMSHMKFRMNRKVLA